MNPSDKTPVRIRAAEVGAVQPWQLPQVQGKHRVALVQREERAVEEVLSPDDLPFGDGKLTLAELERIREEARQEGLEEGRAEGFEQGLAEGRAQGHSEGLQQGQQEIAEALQRLGSMMGELEAPLEQSTDELEACLLQLVLELSRAVTGHELGSRPELVQAAVAEALAQLPAESGAVRIHVNPENEMLLQPLVETHEHWSLVADATVTAGGCVLKTANSRVDQTVENRFRQVAAQLRERLALSSDEDRS